MSNGGSIALSTSAIITKPTGNHRDMLWEVRGTGSVIRLPSLTRLNNGNGYDQDITLRAIDGGILDLSSVTHLMDELATDDRRSSIQVVVGGGDSLVYLSSLTTLFDGYGTGPSAMDDGEFSRIAVDNDGTVQLGNLQTLSGTYVLLNGGTADLSTVTSITRGRIDASAGDFTFAGLNNLDATSVFVSGGARLAFPALTSYSHASFGNSQHRVLQASGC